MRCRIRKRRKCKGIKKEEKGKEKQKRDKEIKKKIRQGKKLKTEKEASTTSIL